jgi:hypothetical protein
MGRDYRCVGEPPNHRNTKTKPSLIPKEPKPDFVVAVRALGFDGLGLFMNM